MSGEQTTSPPDEVVLREVPPMRDLAFSILSLLIEAAASQLRINLPAAATEKLAGEGGEPDVGEARAAIDAANALLASVRTIMENDALHAIEGMLTQLQIEYVRCVSRRP